MTIQSNSSSPSAIDIAGRTHRNVFVVYLFWIVIAAGVTAFLTWALWRAANRQQDAIILETNERAAGLEKEAADARRRQAEAETKLAQVRKQLEPRFIRLDIFKDALRGTEPHSVGILYPKGSDEAMLAAGHLAAALRKATDWDVSGPIPESATSLAAGGQPSGITIRTRDLNGAAKIVSRTLNQEDFEAATVLDETLPDKTLRIIVAPRL